MAVGGLAAALLGARLGLEMLVAEATVVVIELGGANWDYTVTGSLSVPICAGIDDASVLHWACGGQ